jgi:hypothetical protein
MTKEIIPSRRFRSDNHAHRIKPSGRFIMKEIIVPCAQAASCRHAPHLRHESQVPLLRWIIEKCWQPTPFFREEIIIPPANDNLYTNYRVPHTLSAIIHSLHVCSHRTRRVYMAMIRSAKIMKKVTFIPQRGCSSVVPQEHPIDCRLSSVVCSLLSVVIFSFVPQKL